MSEDDVIDQPGGAADDQQQIDLTAPAIQDAIRAAAEAASKADRDKIKEFRENNIALQKKLKEFEALGDPKKIRDQLAHINESEESRLIAAGNLDEVLAKRTETMRKDFASKLEVAEQQHQELMTELAARDKKLFDLQISNEVQRSAAGKVNPDAVPLVVSLAGQVWQNEEGILVPRKVDGSRWFGRDGRKDISAAEWIDSLKDTFPSLFPAPSGGGARGGIRGRLGGVDLDSMSPQEKMNYGRRNQPT